MALQIVETVNMKLYFYNDGIEPNRTAPIFEFSAECNHELVEQLDEVLFARYGRMGAYLAGFNPYADCGISTTMVLIDPISGRYYGRVYIVEDVPSIRVEGKK